MLIGQNIKKYRKEKKLTQKELALIIGKKEITVRKYESGDITLNVDMLQPIATALSVSINDLMKDTEEKAFADALFDGDYDKARNNSMSLEEQNAHDNENIQRFCANNKAESEIRPYYFLIKYIVQRDFYRNLRELYNFLDSITKEEFEEIKLDLNTVGIGKLTMLKVKKEGDSNG